MGADGPDGHPATQTKEEQRKALYARLTELDNGWHEANRRVRELEALDRREAGKARGLP